MPIVDDIKTGHKFPFNACEILCSENTIILNKILENTKLANEDDDSDDSNNFKNNKLKSDNSNSRKYSNNLSDNSSEGSENEISEKNKNNENEDLSNLSDENKESLIDLTDKIKKETKEKLNSESKILEDDIINKIKNINDINKKSEENVENIEPIENQIEINHINNLVGFDDELNFVKSPESSTDENSLYQNLEKLQLNKTDNKTTEKKIIFSENLDDFENENKENINTDKKFYHKKKKNLQSINFNIDNLIMENNDQLKNSSLEEEDKNNEHSSSCLNVSLQSEVATYSFPNLEYFFEFLEQDDLNYVLSGYFSKIFNHLINNKNYKLIKYIFIQNCNFIDKLIKNIKRKSISDCLYKLLIMPIDENEIKEGNEIKINIVENIFEKINTFDNESIINVSELIVECLKNKNFYLNFISQTRIFEIIYYLITYDEKKNIANSDNELINILDANENKKNEILKCILKILNKLNENILKFFGSNIITPSINNEAENFFNLQSINLDAGVNSVNDDESNNQFDSLKVKNKLDEISGILSIISYKIIQEYKDSEKNVQDNLTILTTFDISKRIFGTKRYNKQNKILDY